MPDRAGSTVAIIPALNEADTIGPVVRALLAHGLRGVLVVDNGSTDDTAARARAAGATVIAEPRRGYGRACATGLDALPDGAEWVLFCDADGSDDPADIPRLLAAAENADLVLGDRRATPAGRGALTPVQNFGNALATSLIRLGWGVRFHDLGPLRLVRRDALERINMRDRGFGWTVEMQARAAELSLRCREIPVAYRPRQGGTSKISGTLRGSFLAGTIILATLARLWLQRPGAQRAVLAASVALLLAGACVMLPFGDFRTTGTVPPFLAGAGLMTLGFLAALLLPRPGLRSLWLVAIAARLLLLPMYPGDDLWRYQWEGRALHAGFSPYTHAPNHPDLIPLRDEVWQRVQHRDISAVYPPLAQEVFRRLGALSESVLFWKLAFIAADLAIGALLCRRFGTRAALRWLWNPLVLYCIAGAAHYDSLFILPLVLGWLAWERTTLRGTAAAAGFTVLSVGIKWVSLAFLGWLLVSAWRRHGLRPALALAAASIAGLAAVIFLPALGTLPSALVPRDFALYARSAEFLPWLLHPLDHLLPHGNTKYLLPVALLGLWLLCRERDAARFLVTFYLGLLACSPAVHAWYFLWALPAGAALAHPAALTASISAFAYFWLQHTKALGGPWEQSLPEKLLLWLPIVAAAVWTARRRVTPRP